MVRSRRAARSARWRWVVGLGVVLGAAWGVVQGASAQEPQGAEAAPCEAPAHTEAEAVAMLEAANAEIKRAGEHPTDADLARLLPLLRGAAEAGLLEAQLRYGNYVYGYWATDDMFWPSRREEAVKALAMLRVAALRIEMVRPVKAADDPLVNALGQTPPRWDGEVPQPPKAWEDAAVAEADRWLRCRPDVVVPTARPVP